MTGDRLEGSPIQVLYTPASLAEDTEAGEELARIAADHRAGEDKRLSKDLVAELRASGWLRQARWRRGGYFTTSGLRAATGGPELAMLNVPSALAPWAHRLLNRIADYVMDSGARLRPGEIFSLTDPGLPDMTVTFDLIEPGDLQEPEFARTMLVIVPLP